MPWKPYTTRRKTEVNPTARDIWLALRQMQNVVGGMSSQVASIALSVNRSDARIEHVVSEFGHIVTELRSATEQVAELLNAALREDVS